MNATPEFSVVVPTTGNETRLLHLLAALERQTLPRDRFEVIVAFDGVPVPRAIAERAGTPSVTIVRVEPRRGPGGARNHGAAAARGEFLAFTEDDVTPASDWLANAARRFEVEPLLDVLEGVTVKPGGQAVRIAGEEAFQFLPTNLFVRRSRFASVGGYCEGYFDSRTGIYFREDADLGYALEEAGARLGRDISVVVEHPLEHPRGLDPLRWARRYEMDALLLRRHPQRFHDRIEIHALGPFRIRRPIVRACFAYVVALLAALILALAGQPGLAWVFLVFAGLALVPIWAKWRFEPLRLPVVLLVPFVLVWSYVAGFARLRTLDLAGGGHA